MLLLAFGLFLVIRFLSVHVTVVHPTQGVAVQVVYATGSVEASIMLPLASRSTGRLQELLVDEGMSVKKGDLLATLENSELTAALSEALALEKFAEKEMHRTERLLQSNAVSIQTQEQAKVNWESAVAARKRIEAQIDFLLLRSPDTCTIIQRDGEIGQLIAANQAVFWLQCSRILRITADVDEEDVVLVKEGQEVLIRADAYPESVFRGIVAAITPRGDPITRSYRVRVVFTEEHPLRIGMTAEVNIITQKNDDTTLLPVRAVHNGNILVVEDRRLVRKAVTTGIIGLETIEVLTELSTDMQILAVYDRSLKTGQQVRTQLIDSREE